MTAIAAAVAITSFSRIERGFQQVATQEVPLMNDALRLSVAYERHFSCCRASRQRQKRGRPARLALHVAAHGRTFTEIVESAAPRGPAAFATVEAVSGRLNANLTALEGAVRERSDLRKKLETRLDAVHGVHAKISEKLAPIVARSYSDVVAIAEDIGSTGDRLIKSLVNDGLQLAQTLAEIGAETNLASGLMAARRGVVVTAHLDAVGKSLQRSVRRVQHNLGKLPSGPRVRRPEGACYGFAPAWPTSRPPDRRQCALVFNRISRRMKVSRSHLSR